MFLLLQATIEEAAAALEKLMMEAKLNEASKPNIDVDMKILDSCCQLFAAIQVKITLLNENIMLSTENV